MLRNPVRLLRYVGYVEGASFLLLLFIAMPLKYLAGEPGMVRVVGMAHGVLWVLYIAVLAMAWPAARWGWRNGLLAFGASIIPFGPFAIDPHLKREEAKLADPDAASA